jgi:hypothetical protein
MAIAEVGRFRVAVGSTARIKCFDFSFEVVWMQKPASNGPVCVRFRGPACLRMAFDVSLTGCKVRLTATTIASVLSL